MRHEIEGNRFYSWTDVKKRYTYFEKKYGVKLTREILDKLVEEGVIEAHQLPVEGTPDTYTVYSESDIIFAFARSKFKKVQTEQWF